MILFKKLLLFWLILPLAFPQEISDAETPLIIEINQAELDKRSAEEAEAHCTSWRVAVEANNLSPWKTVAEECGDYVKEYMRGRGYRIDLQRVADEAVLYARSVNLSGDGKLAWVFDVDETLLSNLPYYAQHGYGSEIFDSRKFDEWVEMGTAPAIESSLKVYEEVLNLGFKIILLTGRSERHRSITLHNLFQSGFRDWSMLILRSSEDHGKTATSYKSEKRREVEQQGYQIVGNSGDQWSDLLGSSMSIRSFKLPNPMYYIP
ncbi:acid phosphatase 1-like [Salvia miltiorrhiza]|uniref:acid phosphatase 1-like n=1 Tax=Salvia miltiorrhiza TaxID=226208 RepID=UPI0025ABBC31|nr:acid phosphatase 1-like [Salvia miltiorrhiza]